MTIDPAALCPTMQRMRAPDARLPVPMPPSNLILCRIRHLIYLAERMRDDEIEQYTALTGMREYNPESAAAGFIGTPGPRFTLLGKDGFPCCSGGFQELMPGIWQSWMVGSMDGWAENWRGITKATRYVMDDLLTTGARRLQTMALASRTAACDWYVRGLGMQYEGTMRSFGAQGQDVAIFARIG